MQADYVEIFTKESKEIAGPHKNVSLPFNHISARAIIVRKKDGSIVGTLHRKKGRYALPGGAMEDGESTLEAAKRELEEENFSLDNPVWDPCLAVDFFYGYKELSVWHIVVVDDASFGYSEENIESRWISQDEDLWYEGMHENIILALKKCRPELCTKTVKVF